MILKPPEHTGKMGFPAEKCIFLQKHTFSYRKVHFPAKSALSRRKMRSPAFFGGGGGAHGKKPHGIAGGFQRSRIKNASQLSQNFNTMTINPRHKQGWIRTIEGET